MIRINLLPHREMRRERRKKDFVGLGIFCGILSAGACFLMVTFIAQMISAQNARNEFVKAENAKLEIQIKEIASLRADIAALKARQQAVENLQSDRTLPVHLLDELVKRVPEGIFLKAIKQDDLKVTITGVAQSNDRVSELLRQLSYQTPWLEKPELVEIKAGILGDKAAKDPKRAFEFSLNAFLKRPGKPAGPAVAPATTAAVNPAKLVK